MVNNIYLNFLINLLSQPISELYHLLFFQVYQRVNELKKEDCNVNLIFNDQLLQTKNWNQIKSLNCNEDTKFSDMKKYIDNRIQNITDVNIDKLLKHIFLTFNNNQQATPHFSTFLLKTFEFISLRINNKIKSCDINLINSNPIFLQFLNKDIETCIIQTIIHFLPMNKLLDEAEKSRETSLSMSPYKAKLEEIHANPVQNNGVLKSQVYQYPGMNELQNPQLSNNVMANNKFNEELINPNFMLLLECLIVLLSQHQRNLLNQYQSAPEKI